MTTGTVAAIVAAFILLAIAGVSQTHYESLGSRTRRWAWIPAAVITLAFVAFGARTEPPAQVWYLSAGALAAVAASMQFRKVRKADRSEAGEASEAAGGADERREPSDL